MIRRIVCAAMWVCSFAIAVGWTSNGEHGSAKDEVATCPLTLPNGATVPGIEVDGGFGSAKLWTNLYMWSNGPVVVAPDDQRILADGSISGMKWAWWRLGFGELTVEGIRIDAEAPPLFAIVPDGYGTTGFQPVSITFPTGGCWQITGHLGDSSLTFVTFVIPPYAAESATPAS